MQNVILQILCSFLFAVGLLFILLEFRTGFDRSFRFFGVSLILLCGMTSIDIWILPNTTSVYKNVFWESIYHSLACIFIPFSLWYLCILTESPFLKKVPLLILTSSIFTICFLGKLMIAIKGGKEYTTWAYEFIFLPYILGYVIFANYLILNRLQYCSKPEKKILQIHLAGFAVLIFGGLLDLGVMLNIIGETFVSFTVIGVLAFGIMGSLIFAERFLLIIQDRQTTFGKLETAYRDLEQVTALKQLGESTAMINHEIKNYMFMIAGNAQLLQEFETLTTKGKETVKNIVTSVERLTAFSEDILNISRNEVLREKTILNLPEVIKGTVHKHFPTKSSSFKFFGMEREKVMHGDWGKLEQVFVNIFKNSFEAITVENPEIKIRLSSTEASLLVSIEDNGVGADENQIQNLFKAFFSTKSKNGGSGLGMSITKSIVEGHGGRISAYSKNLEKKGEHGLKLLISFPIYAENIEAESKKKHPIIVVKDGMEGLPEIIRIFQNLRVNPTIVQSASDIKINEFPDGATIMVSTKTMAANFPKLSGFSKLCLVSLHGPNIYVLDHGRGKHPDVFSEEYVVTRMLRKQVPRARFKERQPSLIG